MKSIASMLLMASTVVAAPIESPRTNLAEAKTGNLKQTGTIGELLDLDTAGEQEVFLFIGWKMGGEKMENKYWV